MNVLLFGRDVLLAHGIASLLRNHAGWRIEIAQDQDAFLRILSSLKPSLVVLDYPAAHEEPSPYEVLELCRIAREYHAQIGILFLAWRSALVDKQHAFAAGADDYIARPFEAEELLARASALSRRSSLLPSQRGIGPEDTRASRSTPVDSTSQYSLNWREVSVDLIHQSITFAEKTIELPRRQFMILVYLMTNAGRVVTHAEIREHVFRTAASIDSSALRNHVRDLRRRLGAAGDNIRTVRGIGYGIGIEGNELSSDESAGNSDELLGGRSRGLA